MRRGWIVGVVVLLLGVSAGARQTWRGDKGVSIYGPHADEWGTPVGDYQADAKLLVQGTNMTTMTSLLMLSSASHRYISFPCKEPAPSTEAFTFGCMTDPLAANEAIFIGSDEDWQDFVICRGDDQHCYRLNGLIEAAEWIKKTAKGGAK